MSSRFRPIDPSTDGSRLWAAIPGDWRRPLAKESFEIYWRDRDSFGQIIPRPEPWEVARFYEVETYYTHGAAETGRSGRESFLARLVFHLAWRMDRGIDTDDNWWLSQLGNEPRDVLEIGCGNGSTLQRLSRLGHNCLGIEPDPLARAAARQSGVDVLEGTAESLPEQVANRQFDCVVLSHVLEHCIDPFKAIQNIRALLRPNSILIIEVPNNACAGLKFFGNVWLWLDVPRHLNFFTRASLRALLSNYGFAESKVEYLGYCRQFGEPWQKAQAEIAQQFKKRKPNGIVNKVAYLTFSAFARPDKKYDSVRVIAHLSRPNEDT